MKKQITGTFTNRAYRMYEHMGRLAGVEGTSMMRMSTGGREPEDKPVVLFPEHLKLQNYVSFAAISEELVSALQLQEGDEVEIELDTRQYSPQEGISVTAGRIAGTDSWIFAQDL